MVVFPLGGILIYQTTGAAGSAQIFSHRERPKSLP
jgi:hypothetical protein